VRLSACSWHGARPGGVAEFAQQFRAGGVKQVIGTESAAQGVQVGQRRGRPSDVAMGDRPVQGGKAKAAGPGLRVGATPHPR
jgi:hypothetical protein